MGADQSAPSAADAPEQPNAAPMEAEAAERLRNALEPTGRLVLPNEKDYDVCRTVKVLQKDAIGKPVAIIIASTPSDVTVAVQFCAATQYKLSVAAAKRSHLCMVTDTIVLDVSGMDSIEVNSSDMVAMVGPGATFGMLDKLCARDSIGVTGSYDPEAGIVGATLHGGHGFLERKFGLTCDNAISFEVVTSDGTIVTASSKQNRDLFWALRGGGGNFGVVTLMTLHLHVLPNDAKLLASVIEYPEVNLLPLQSRLEILMSHFAIAEDSPNEYTASIDITGQGVMTTNKIWIGNVDSGLQFFDILQESGRAVLKHEKFTEASYHNQLQQLVTNSGIGKKSQHSFIRRIFICIDGESVARVIADALNKGPNHASAVRIQMTGGMAALVPYNGTAVGHRDARHLVEIFGRWVEDHEKDVVLKWVHQTYNRLATIQCKWDQKHVFVAPLDRPIPDDEILNRKMSCFGLNSIHV